MKKDVLIKRDLPRVCADAVGIAHFIVANVIIVIGEFTHQLDELGAVFPGLAFVYRYLDLPVYLLLENWDPGFQAATIKILLFGQIVIALSSALYAFFAWVIVYAFTTSE